MMFILAMLLALIATSAGAAEFLGADFAFIQSDPRSFQPRWIPGGAFSDILQREDQERRDVFLIGHKNMSVRYDLKRGSRKKRRFRLSPNVFIKPVLIIEELQTFLRAHQTRELASAYEHAQAKAIIPLDALTRVKPVVANARIFSFTPYYHKMYGIYLQIIW